MLIVQTAINFSSCSLYLVSTELRMRWNPLFTPAPFRFLPDLVGKSAVRSVAHWKYDNAFNKHIIRTYWTFELTMDQRNWLVSLITTYARYFLSDRLLLSGAIVLIYCQLTSRWHLAQPFYPEQTNSHRSVVALQANLDAKNKRKRNQLF